MHRTIVVIVVIVIVVIVQHVLKDKRVLALAQKKAAEAEGGGEGQCENAAGRQWDMDEIVIFVREIL